MNCLIEGCARIERGTRGLCRDHYQVAVRRIRQGKTTWEELEKLGLCEKSKKTKRGDLAFSFDEQLSKQKLIKG